MRRLVLLAVLAASGCSKKPAMNYKHCLKLRIGMNREQLAAIMGEPEDTIPYVEGKSLPNMQGKTTFEWSTPATMPGPVGVNVDDKSGLITGIHCADIVVTAAYVPEPPPESKPAPAPAPELSTAPVSAPRPPAGPRENSNGATRSSGRPLTQ